VGILRDQVLGPVILPNKLTDAVYHRFLLNDLPVLLEQVPLHQRQHLNLAFGEHWIGRGGPFNWPGRYPDLNPLDLPLSEHLETLVYSAPINELAVLQQQVENACQEIRVKPGILDGVRTSCNKELKDVLKCIGTT
jgi:hypothetical protein